MAGASGANIKIAQIMNTRDGHAAPPAGRWLEICEATVLALVAVATAWSGYEAALWGGLQAQFYGESSKRRVGAAELELLGHEQREYDSSVVVEWMKASQEGKEDLARFFERRF